MTAENDLFIDFCKNGNQKSFEELFFRIKPWLSKMLYKIVGDTDATYDLQQEIWIILINTCCKFDPERGKINNYIFTIAKNEALRWKFNKQKSSILNNDEMAQTKFGIESKTPEHIVHLNERCRTIQNAISKLNTQYQDVIIMHYFAELDVTEISLITNIPEGTIKCNLKRGREKLKKILQKFEDI